MRRTAASLLLAVAMIAPLSGLTAESAATERTTAQQQFRIAFDAGDYRQALVLARRVVELTSGEFGSESIELSTPLTNLGTTLLRMDQREEAFSQYSRASALLDEHAHPGDARRIAPLQGIASVLQAANRHQEAIVVLEEAVKLVRMSEGLDSPAQLPLLSSLAESHDKAHHWEEASRLRLRIFDTAERAYGADDARMVGPLCDLADWYVKSGRRSGARVLYLRAVQLADRDQSGNLAAIRPLRGVARTYLSKQLDSAEYEKAKTLSELPRSVMRAGIPNFRDAPPGEGQSALRDAVERLGGASPERALERGRLLVELGDLQRLSGSTSEAIRTWTEAWADLSRGGDTSLLDRPTVVRRVWGRRLRTNSPATALSQEVQLRLSVTAQGRVDDAAIVQPQMRGTWGRQVEDAMSDFIVRPAFSEGQAVAVNDFLYREMMYIPVGQLSAGQ